RWPWTAPAAQGSGAGGWRCPQPGHSRDPPGAAEGPVHPPAPHRRREPAGRPGGRRSGAPAARAPAARRRAAVPDGAVAVAARPGPPGRVRCVGAGEPGRPAADPGPPEQGRRLQLHPAAGRRQLLRARRGGGGAAGSTPPPAGPVPGPEGRCPRRQAEPRSAAEPRQRRAARTSRIRAAPAEFGIMLVMPVEKDSHILLKFLDEDGKLSALKIRSLENITVFLNNVNVVNQAGSPAITLLIKNPASEISVDITLTLEAQQSWPPNTQDGLKIEQWLGRKVKGEFRKKKSPYLVQDPLFLILWNGNTWRLSFSHIEKAMMNNHGSSKTCCESDGLKCCRKGCLKLLKYLLEELKMKYTKKLAKFFSYHVKTAFFHSCVMWPKDTDWHWADLDHCFWKYLGYFLECLQNTQLPHFFIPKYSLLSLEDKVSSDFLSRQINDQLNNRFPVFQESLKKKIIVYNK
uniref:Cyclic GMP-AMP synthase n=1 Tax=Falco tinnunculus TaxID=100819 RepID=A0A8C4VF94_FALTI